MPSRMLSILKSIQGSAERYVRQNPAPAALGLTDTPLSPIPSKLFEHTLIPDIEPELQKLDLPPHVASRLSSVYTQKVRQLLETMEVKCRQIIENERLPSRTWRRLMDIQAKFVQKQIDSLNSEIQTRAQAMVQSRQSLRPKFHPEFTPLLESYFKQNAYPSAPDRIALAKKTNMTPRQIEVWFQNHRNRTRREGKPLRKCTPSFLPAASSIPTPIDSPEPVFKPDHNLLPCHDFESIASPTTFPVKYTPSLVPTGFPIPEFPEPVWAQKPRKSGPLKPAMKPTMAINDFAIALECHLNLWDGPGKSRRVASRILERKSSTGHLTSRLKPRPAPLPALLRIPQRHRIPQRQFDVVAATPQQRRSAFLGDTLPVSFHIRPTHDVDSSLSVLSRSANPHSLNLLQCRDLAYHTLPPTSPAPFPLPTGSSADTQKLGSVGIPPPSGRIARTSRMDHIMSFASAHQRYQHLPLAVS